MGIIVESSSPASCLIPHHHLCCIWQVIWLTHSPIFWQQVLNSLILSSSLCHHRHIFPSQNSERDWSIHKSLAHFSIFIKIPSPPHGIVNCHLVLTWTTWFLASYTVAVKHRFLRLKRNIRAFRTQHQFLLSSLSSFISGTAQFRWKSSCNSYSDSFPTDTKNCWQAICSPPDLLQLQCWNLTVPGLLFPSLFIHPHCSSIYTPFRHIIYN